MALAPIRMWLRALLLRRRVESEMEKEMRLHLELETESNVRAGMTAAEARRAALLAFGGVERHKEAVRDARVTRWLEQMLADGRYAFRGFRRNPVFAVVAIASLALGIGANTAIYTLLEAVVLRPLPVPNPEELVVVTLGDVDAAGAPESPDRGAIFTNPLWEQVRDHATGFTAIAAFSETEFNIADGGFARRVRGQWVSGDFFALFGMTPASGRLLTRGDDVRGCPATAVLAHGFWQSEYAGRRDVIGTAISLEGKPFAVVGVTAPGFTSPEVGREAQVYVPLCTAPVVGRARLDERSRWWLRVMGRRDPSLTIEQLRARVKGIAPAAYAATVPERWSAEDKTGYRRRTMSVFPAKEGLSDVRDRYGAALRAMMAAVAVVLLIACANVSNLLLARAASRHREVAIRMAIGAGRERLVRQLITESALLALLGAMAGLIVAHWGARGLVALISPPGSPVSLDLSLNARVLGFTTLVVAGATVVFGLVPAWRGTRVSPQAAMKATARSIVEGHGRFTIGKMMVVAQVALSLALLVGAGLLVGSLRTLQTTDPGFTADGVMIVTANFGRAGLQPAQRATSKRTALERIRSLPGVRSAATTELTPVGRSRWNEILYVDGFTPATPEDAVVWFNEVSEDYFATMETRLVAGRDFETNDVPAGPKIAIVNQSMAAKFYAQRSPIGQQFRLKAGDTFQDPVTIVGVVEDAKYSSLREENSATVYLPASQQPDATQVMTLVLRADGDPRSLAPAIRQVFAEVHRSVTLETTMLGSQVARSLQRERMLAVLSTLFGSVALSLSMLGLYGVMAYTVARRRNEIGVRIALGADRARLLRLVLGDVVRVVMVGLVLGVAGAIVAGKLVASFLFGLEPTEPVVLGGAALLLLSVAIGAGLMPAMRASRVDPVAALRQE